MQTIFKQMTLRQHSRKQTKAKDKMKKQRKQYGTQCKHNKVFATIH